MLKMEKLNKLKQQLEELESKDKKTNKLLKDLGIGLILILLLGGVVYGIQYLPGSSEKVCRTCYDQGATFIYSKFIEELSQCKQVPVVLADGARANAFLVECLEGR